MRMPGTVPPKTIGEQVSFVDIEPTIRELLGIAPRRGRARALAGAAVARRGSSRSGRRSSRDRTCASCAPAAGRTCGAATGGWCSTAASGSCATRSSTTSCTIPLSTKIWRRATRRSWRACAALFEREAPTARDAPVAVVHLRVAPDERPHVVDGTLHSDGAISLRGVAGAEASPVDAHTVRLTLARRGAGRSGDRSADGEHDTGAAARRHAGAPREVLLGEFALPLLAERPSCGSTATG